MDSKTMRTAFVTGASGLVGTNLVQQLQDNGWSTVALSRSGIPTHGFDEREYTRIVSGDVTDRGSIEKAMPEAVDAVFHVAGNMAMWKGMEPDLYRVNVEGTRNVVETALRKKAKRLIHVSSVASYAPVHGEVLSGQPSDRAKDHWIDYFRTKFLGDEEVRKGVREGLNAVLIHPGHILGGGGTSGWSALLLQMHAGTLKRSFPGSGPWNHVASVAEVLRAAADRGRVGQSYLLGGAQGSYRDVCQGIAKVLGVPPPPTVGALPLKLTARIFQLKSMVNGKRPRLTPETAHFVSLDFSCDSRKATQELGYRERSIETMIKDTHEWLKSKGALS
ncbi:MAG: NAD-dependent epimerase/dehydratase family protein [Myxococcales bacterium]|nr:NAD-dependent epimerase/dehydratase family protein [Myxococcales bacterium]